MMLKSSLMTANAEENLLNAVQNRRMKNIPKTNRVIWLPIIRSQDRKELRVDLLTYNVAARGQVTSITPTTVNLWMSSIT